MAQIQSEKDKMSLGECLYLTVLREKFSSRKKKSRMYSYILL